jgi:hypothetical protein
MPLMVHWIQTDDLADERTLSDGGELLVVKNGPDKSSNGEPQSRAAWKRGPTCQPDRPQARLNSKVWWARIFRSQLPNADATVGVGDK